MEKKSVVRNSNGPLILDNSNYNVSGETESFKNESSTGYYTVTRCLLLE